MARPSEHTATDSRESSRHGRRVKRAIAWLIVLLLLALGGASLASGSWPFGPFEGKSTSTDRAGAGEPGPRGPKGDKGDNGDRGDQGAKGDKGDKGDAGSAGPSGQAGSQGPAGPRGSLGAMGLRGLAGLTGAQGPQGAQGDQGPHGLQGLPGLQGDAGPQGNPGANGDPGDPGPKGDQGPPGASGVSTQVIGGGSDTNVTNGRFMPLFSDGSCSTESQCQQVMPLAGVVDSFYVQIDSAPGSGKAWRVTVRKNGADTALSCDILAGAASCSNTVDSVAFAAGDLISVQAIKHPDEGTPSGTRMRWTGLFSAS